MLAYVPWALIPCAIMFVVFYFVSKRDNANSEELMKKVPEEARHQIKAERYRPTEGRNMYTTRGYVADISEDGSKAKVFIIFYNTPRGEFYNQTAKMSTEELQEKGIQSGTFVPCLMKLDEEYQIYGFKKLAYDN